MEWIAGAFHCALAQIGTLRCGRHKAARPVFRRQAPCQHFTESEPLPFVTGGVDVSEILRRYVQVMHLRHRAGQCFIHRCVHSNPYLKAICIPAAGKITDYRSRARSTLIYTVREVFYAWMPVNCP